MIGFRIAQMSRRVGPHIVKAFLELPVANVSDCMSRLASLGHTIRPHHGGGSVLAGPAITVRTRPGDNLVVHKALDLAKPGDVVVVDAGGDLTNAIVGELMLSHAMSRGLAGIVINGAVRDLKWIRANDFPVFAVGVTHRGPYKDGPGEINYPISINGAVIESGDLIVGDEDGILSVRYDEAESLLELARDKFRAEQQQLVAISEGRNDRGWVDDALRERGVRV